MGNDSCAKNNEYDPLKVCLGIDFQANGQIKPHSKECQQYLAQYCSQKWDNVCEFLSHNERVDIPNMASVTHEQTPQCSAVNSICSATAGIDLVRNSAYRKYMIGMLSNSSGCPSRDHSALIYQPFDYNVPNSPIIATFNKKPITVILDVDPSNIDNDPLMNKMLNDPKHYMDIFENILRTRKTNGTLYDLEHTRLGDLITQSFFKENYRNRYVYTTQQ